jgi:hypothetical protein
MKTVKATRQTIEALNQAGRHNGRLDKAAVERSLDRILKAARQINREVSELLTRARR